MYNDVMSMSDLVYAHLLMSFALLPALVTIYVMPMLIASERRHKHVNAIVVFNILTGWTFSAGYLVCLGIGRRGGSEMRYWFAYNVVHCRQ